MSTVNIYEAKTKLSQLVEEAPAGNDVIIARGGKPVARLTQLTPNKRVIRFGVLKSKITVADDFDAPLAPGTLAARARIEDANAVYVSAASIWEIAIKSRLDKIDGNLEELEGAVAASGFLELCVTARHAAQVAKLPLHHADPFDRLLIALALCEPLHMLTADRAFEPYGSAVTML